MDYENALSFIYSRRKFEKSSGFERIEALLKILSEPQKKMKFIHVVGTNGKGSVSTMISSALMQAGVVTGLFTSPFVTDFRERIKVDGKYIEKDEFSSITQRVKAACEKIEADGLCPTFFECVLACALVYFKEKNCGMVVLEAGIGGENDSTNIIPPPLVSVITSVSFDHTEVLGDTLEKIARAKSGVIKSGSAVVSFPKESCGLDFVAQHEDVCRVLEGVCKSKGCKLIYPNMKTVKSVFEKDGKTEFSFEAMNLRIGFMGHHQIANAAVSVCVLKALREIGEDISDEDIANGLNSAFIPARMEMIGEAPAVMIDGGHNEGCMKALSAVLKNNFPEKKITAVLGFMKDKDYPASIKIIAPFCENIVFTLADKARGEAPAVLEKCAEGLCDNVFSAENIDLAVKKALSLTAENDLLLCAGSFYLVSEIRKIFKR